MFSTKKYMFTFVISKAKHLTFSNKKENAPEIEKKAIIWIITNMVYEDKTVYKFSKVPLVYAFLS